MAMPRTRIKICGLTHPDDAEAATRLGVDAIGLVFYPPSPRAVSLDQARAIYAALGPLVTPVALFVDAQPALVESVLAALPRVVLQFHGDEGPEACQRYGQTWIKALRMSPDLDLEAALERYRAADAVLLDSYQPGVPGGTGQRFDWARVPGMLGSRLILAGGLTPQNVGEAIAQVRPAVVDVSGGVESAPGEKSPALMADLVAAVRVADNVQGALPQGAATR